jgi:DNA polymerase-3 subunit alpha/error-prone DNA polymerase
MIPLAVHSGYSFLAGTCRVDDLCRHAASLGYDKMALTDTDNLCGLWHFIDACRRYEITPIIGAEITEPDSARRAVCLVKNTQGYSNLCRLLTCRHMKTEFDLGRELASFGKGMVILAADPDLLCSCHDAGLDIAAALCRHFLPAGSLMYQTALGLNIPVAAVPDIFFARPGQHRAHLVLRAIAENTILCRVNHNKAAPADAWLDSPQKYRQRFAAFPEAIAETRAIAERICFSGPDFGHVMPPYKSFSEKETARRLRMAAFKGARRRYKNLTEEVRLRLDHELEIISSMGFAGYFLVVADIVRQSPRTCGRGSGAASLVAYCLGITNVCPIKHNLYFERFLNQGRRDPPDLDIDFAWDERDAVIAGVLSKYHGRTAMVANHVCFGHRMAVRETARVFGMTETEIAGMTHGSDPVLPWPEIYDLAGQIEGLPRNLSLHPGGVVITPKEIDWYAPVEKAPKGVCILQWDKDGVEDAGLVKIDLLGNRSLGVIRDAVAAAGRNGTKINETIWCPEDDPKTRKLIARGLTMGCFYIESPAMRLLQKKSQRGDFEHLVIHSSIIRPAANEVIREYLKRLHGKSWQPLHPLLTDVLNQTYGLMVYQEDVSRVAVCVAGFSHAEADGLRKAMSKKDRNRRLADYYEQFAAGAGSRGLGHREIEKIWAMIMSFNGYSFCKPHSASYARVSFQAAYLKVHFPAEFMAAVISNQGGFYSTFAYVSEARRMGLRVLPADVEKSRISWTGRKKFLRTGLMSVKYLSSAAQHRIIRERGIRSFESASDFFSRVCPDETEARALINSGALDRFHPDKNRASLLWQFCARDRKERCRQPSLFTQQLPSGSVPHLPEDNLLERLRREFAVLGFLCDRHPITLFDSWRKKYKTVEASDIGFFVGCRLNFAGWLITGKTVLSKKGDPMEFVTFEDETGLVETTFFPGPFKRFGHLLCAGRPFLVSGVVENDMGAVTLRVDGLKMLARLQGN